MLQPLRHHYERTIPKIGSLAFNMPLDTHGGPHFSDVSVGSTFYDYVETLFNAAGLYRATAMARSALMPT